MGWDGVKVIGGRVRKAEPGPLRHDNVQAVVFIYTPGSLWPTPNIQIFISDRYRRDMIYTERGMQAMLRLHPSLTESPPIRDELLLLSEPFRTGVGIPDWLK